jgi:DNA repair protein RadC
MQSEARRGHAYVRRSEPIIFDNTARRYILTIRDLPSNEKPREKLLARGPSSLSTRELLAALLHTGTTREGVLAMSSRIMQEYGAGSIMNARNPTELARELEIPLGKAIQIVAAAELGRRFFEKNAAAAPIVRTAAEVFEYVKGMGALTKEHLRGIYLNAHYKIIHDEVISIGTIDANIVHAREVFRPALEYAAAAVILAHNHPSGETTPSATDIATTKELIAAGTVLGIDLVDHVIVTKDSFMSIPADYRL